MDDQENLSLWQLTYEGDLRFDTEVAASKTVFSATHKTKILPNQSWIPPTSAQTIFTPASSHHVSWIRILDKQTKYKLLQGFTNSILWCSNSCSLKIMADICQDPPRTYSGPQTSVLTPFLLHVIWDTPWFSFVLPCRRKCINVTLTGMFLEAFFAQSFKSRKRIEGSGWRTRVESGAWRCLPQRRKNARALGIDDRWVLVQGEARLSARYTDGLMKSSSLRAGSHSKGKATGFWCWKRLLVYCLPSPFPVLQLFMKYSWRNQRSSIDKRDDLIRRSISLLNRQLRACEICVSNYRLETST